MARHIRINKFETIKIFKDRNQYKPTKKHILDKIQAHQKTIDFWTQSAEHEQKYHIERGPCPEHYYCSLKFALEYIEENKHKIWLLKNELNKL